MESVERAFLLRVVRKVKKDGTGHLVLVVGLSAITVHLNLILPVLASAPFKFAIEGKYYAYLILSATGVGFVDLECTDISSVGLDTVDYSIPFKLMGSEALGSTFGVALRERVDVTVDVGLQGWWKGWRATDLADVELAERARLESPSRLKHCYNSEELEPENPGLQRFLIAEPLPVPHKDEKSAWIWKNVIEPNKTLFEVGTTIDVSEFERLCEEMMLPNRPHWSSYVAAFRFGGTPWVGSFAHDPVEPKRVPNARMSACELAFVHEQRDKEIEEGHWSVGFDSPLPYMRVSPLSVVPKPGKSKYRLIQNASAPRGDSFNDQILRADSTLRLDTMKELIHKLRYYHSRGQRLSLWTVDVTAFFRHFPYHPLVALRNCVMVEDGGRELFHVDRRACFGGRSNPKYCSNWGDILIALLFAKHGSVDVLHYIDDFFGVSAWRDGNEAPVGMQQVSGLFKQLHVPTSKPQKGDTIALLGLSVCYSNGCVSIRLDKLVKYLSAIRFVLAVADGKVAFKDLEKLRGQLSWSTCVVVDGVTQNRPIHAMLHKWNGLRDKGIRIRLSEDARSALRWWDERLSTLPRRFIYEEVWWKLADADRLWFTDASSTLGLGLYEPDRLAGYWHVYETGCLTWDIDETKKVHINCLELLAVVSVVSLLRSEKWRGRLVILSDSMVTCNWCAAMDAKPEAACRLLRILAADLKDGIDMRVLHIPGEMNPADGLSRGESGIKKALKEVPLNSLCEFAPSFSWLHGMKLFEE